VFVGKASDWLREERRKTLGDWVAFCLSCGFTQRYFADFADEVPAECPQCGGEIRSQCPTCGARFSSAFAVECEECGAEIRPRQLFGTPIRKRASR
jgi:predicted nucleic acid-binding Zn ribbon protein